MKIKKIIKSTQVFEGAGVKLNRVFGFQEVPLFDPFLLLDHFKSDHPQDYLRGFPWHPHRGIETVTYMLKGEIEHADSLGNLGIIQSGDVQWMTAGSGIIHQEMPQQGLGINGFQLWVNLAAKDKMTAPKYREILSKDIPEISHENYNLKVISGKFNETTGAVDDVNTDPQYFDVSLKPNTNFKYQKKEDYCLFLYHYEGVLFHNETKIPHLAAMLFEGEDELVLETKDEESKFLLISGKPIRQSIEWQGPIVMNNRKEIMLAFEEFQNGTFIKHK